MKREYNPSRRLTKKEEYEILSLLKTVIDGLKAEEKLKEMEEQDELIKQYLQKLKKELKRGD
jgi:vacuolar-type H+-ATPase subunit E/Vma4